MSSSPEHDTHQQQKHDYYTRSDIVDAYESSRFGRPSGQWIRRIEEGAINELLDAAQLDASGVALDLATGTGRNLPFLARRCATVIAGDLSLPMLQAARARAGDTCVACDAARIPLRTGSVDCVLASRFFFHFDDLEPFLREIARVLKDEGYVLFDVCNWTPRTWIPGRQQRIGGRMFLHRRARVERLAAATGFTVRAAVGTFAMPPFLYQHLPLPVVRVIETTGTVLLGGYRNKVYYLLRKQPALR